MTDADPVCDAELDSEVDDDADDDDALVTLAVELGVQEGDCDGATGVGLGDTVGKLGATTTLEFTPALLLPSCPSPFQPKHCSVPPARIMHDWPPPQATADAPLAPVMTLGTLELPPAPSWPCEFFPQHEIPVLNTAHVWYHPAEIMVAPDKPDTLTGMLDRVFPLFPSSPSVLNPQQLTAPPDTSAHAW